ncbi:MAG: transcriptional regulator [Bacteroidetes bacterium]|nr:MAG: transcriptional regulator [Bacteroidota bacterium]
MKHKNTSFQSNELLSHFNSIDVPCFNSSDAFKVLHKSSKPTVNQLLSSMTQRGLLMRIKEGVYYIIPYEKNSETFMPDWHLITEKLVDGTAHYIAYYSALQIHNLITQPSLKQQIVVAKQIRPSTIKVKDISFQYIYHNPNHFFGVKNVWIDSFHKAKCSDLEKTIIDCLFKPDYAGGIVEIAKAIYMSKEKINFEKLLEYVKRFNSQAVIKRLGFLLEILEIEQPIINYLQKARTASYVVLDTELPKEGKRLSRWSIQQNIDIETIKSSIYT